MIVVYLWNLEMSYVGYLYRNMPEFRNPSVPD